MAVVFETTGLDGVVLCKPEVIRDEGGFSSEFYHAQKYYNGGIRAVFVQDNCIRSCRNVLRGLHFRLHKPQTKLIGCTHGEIFDVAVDIRKGSSTFGQWTGAVLSEENSHQLFIPGGFAHGFCVLSETAEIFCKCSEFFCPSDDRGIRWNDTDIGVKWPVENPILSAGDKIQPLLRDCELPCGN